MPASRTSPRRISARRCAPPAPRAPTSISTMSAARSPTPCCATSTRSGGSPCAARSRSTTPPRRRWARACSAPSSASACGRRASSSPTSPSATRRRAARWATGSRAASSSTARISSKASTRRRAPSSACCAARISARCWSSWHEPPRMSYDAPFAGLKVIDLSQGIAGPYCAMLLAQHGAEVIKVEGIGEGDWARTLGTRYGSHSAYSIIGNLGKRSIAIDLKTEAGKRVLRRLLEGADVFLEGFRPGAIRRLGFDYDSVAAREPRLLYLSISGFGQTGPLADRPAMDPVLQAYTGLMIENRGEDGIPHRVPVIVVDMSTAVYAFQALSAALYARRDETRGRYIDVSLMQAATPLQSIRLMACHLEGGTMKPGGVPGGVFQMADGWLSMVAINDRDWRALCAALQMPALADDPRFATPALRLANDVALYAIVRPALAAEPWAVWSKRLTEARLMHERLNSYAEFLDQPHVRETGLIQWLTQAGLNRPVPVPALPGMLHQLDGTPRATAPVSGQHTRSILTQYGYSAAEIETLLAQGPVAAAA